MKKLLFSILAIATVTISSIAMSGLNPVNQSSNSQFNVESAIQNCRYGQCYATAKSTGNRCKHCVSNEGDLYCWQH